MTVTKGAGCFWMPTDMYPVFIAFVPSEDAWKRAMRRLGLDETPYPTSSAQTGTYINKKTDDLCVLVTVHERNDKNPVGVIACMAHEASHVCDSVFDYIGEKSPGSEQRAYLMEFVMRNLMEAYAKSGRKEPEKEKATCA